MGKVERKVFEGKFLKDFKAWWFSLPSVQVFVPQDQCSPPPALQLAGNIGCSPI